MKMTGALSALLALWLGAGLVSPSHAGEVEIEKATDKLKFSGDLRLRQESFFFNYGGTNVSAAQADRHRQRYRLRWGVTANMQDLTVGLRLASGTGEQTSTNQTFGNASNQKNIYIDQAFLQWKAHEYVRLTGGKMNNPFWRNYSSDLMWDSDLNPEGFAEQIELPAGDRLSLFGNFAQLPINEVSGSARDPWMFGNQLGASVKFSEDTKIRVGITNYAFTNERSNVFMASSTVDSPVLQEANTLVPASNNLLANSFNIMQYMMELTTHLGPLPLSLQADYVKNMAKNSAYGVNGQDKGYQYGAIVGKAKAAKTWEFAYFYKYLEANATIASFVDSDFGLGGTNRKGHIMWVGYAPREYITLQAKYFITSKLNPMINSSTPFGNYTAAQVAARGPEYRDINRAQFDVVVKF